MSKSSGNWINFFFFFFFFLVAEHHKNLIFEKYLPIFKSSLPLKVTQHKKMKSKNSATDFPRFGKAPWQRSALANLFQKVKN